MDDATKGDVPDTKIPDLDVEKAWNEARLLKEDLDKGEGWTQRLHVPNEYNSWSKTFPNEEVPVKVLHRFENMPMSAEKFIEMMSPEKMELRKKWDKSKGEYKLIIGFLFTCGYPAIKPLLRPIFLKNFMCQMFFF